MDLISSFSNGMADLAGFAQPVISFLKGVAESTGLTLDDSPDSWSGVLMSGAAGIAAAMAVALILIVYFRSGYRSVSDIAKHGLAAAVVLGLLAFVAYDMRDAALAYLGMNPSKPEVEFEIRLPKAAATAVADTQIELHTDRNQRLAQIERELAPGDDGRSVLRGWVAARFSHHRPRRDTEPAGSTASPVQTAAGGKPKPLRSVRPVAPRRSRRLARCGRTAAQPAERRLCDPLSRPLGRFSVLPYFIIPTSSRRIIAPEEFECPNFA